jgi:uncharacterized protein (DUF1684 family)
MRRAHLHVFPVVFSLAAALAACRAPAPRSATPPGPRASAAYVKAIHAWRAQRVARLEQKEGWLHLAGLFWLEQGTSRLGSDPAGEIVFPGHAPPRIGALTVSPGELRFSAEPGVRVESGGQVVKEIELQTDAEGKAEPTKIAVGPLTFFVIQRGERLGLRLFDDNAPAARGFRGFEHFPIDEAWRIRARFSPYDKPRSVEMSTVIRTSFSAGVPGEVVFEVGGKTLRLTPLAEPGDAKLFFVFGDRTNGHETHGGGRFLTADAPVDGQVELDFNKAVNPPCALTDYSTCPVPRLENRLPIRVTAGEKAYRPGGVTPHQH